MEMKDGWNVDGTEWKVRLDFGVGAIGFRGAALQLRLVIPGNRKPITRPQFLRIKTHKLRALNFQFSKKNNLLMANNFKREGDCVRVVLTSGQTGYAAAMATKWLAGRRHPFAHSGGPNCFLKPGQRRGRRGCGGPGGCFYPAKASGALTRGKSCTGTIRVRGNGHGHGQYLYWFCRCGPPPRMTPRLTCACSNRMPLVLLLRQRGRFNRHADRHG
jgi:hypothetical protein